MIKNRKVLVTGVAGFIGSNLADRLLKEGYIVVGIDNLSYGAREQVPNEVEFHQLDIRSKEIYPLFENIDFVFHLAAKNCLPDCQKDPTETMDINVMGTANVFEAALRAKVKKILYAESSVLEEGEKRLTGFYAISKMANSWLAAGYRELGLTTVGLRYFNVYGPRQDYRRTSPPIISKFIIQFLKGERPIIFEDDDRNKRDFIYIEDVNDFHLLCLKNDKVNNKMFRLGSGKSTSIKELFEITKRVMGVDIKPIIKNRPPDPDYKPVEPKADISEAKKMGWVLKTLLDEGLKNQIDFLKSEFAKGKIK